MGKPLAAAINWFSVQESLKSFRPRQRERYVVQSVRMSDVIQSLSEVAYHQLPNDSLVKVFGASVDTLSDKITAIDMLVSHASFSLPPPCCPFFLKLPRVSFLLGLSSGFDGGSIFFAVVNQA